MAFMPTDLQAQRRSDFGVWTDLSADKKIGKKASVKLAAEIRTNDNSSQASRWAVGLSGHYHFTKWLKTGAGYDFLYDRRERTTYNEDGSPRKYANYMRPRHRFHADMSGALDLGRFTLQLRERWQYTYTPEKTIDSRYDYATAHQDGQPHTYSGAGKSVLRSRLQVSYDLDQLEPYANVELYNSWAIEKVRYTVGIDWTVTKAHKLGFYYRLQNESSRSDDPDTHVLGASYKLKF
jgi:hypothetical protein